MYAHFTAVAVGVSGDLLGFGTKKAPPSPSGASVLLTAQWF